MLAALAETWRRCMFEPTRFFRSLSPDAPLGPALVYAIGLGVLSAGVSLFWSALFTFAGVTDGFLAALVGAGGDWTWSVVSFLLSPLWLVIGLYVAAAIYHVGLVILGGASKGFGGTLRAVCYAWSPQVLVVVPVLGRLLAFIWCLVLIVVGIREVHGTSTGRAAGAMLLPLLLIIGLFFFIGVFVALATLPA
ncbi:MAG TPA: YIP1 family protein [Longimicrobiales bacterium]